MLQPGNFKNDTTSGALKRKRYVYEMTILFVNNDYPYKKPLYQAFLSGGVRGVENEGRRGCGEE